MNTLTIISSRYFDPFAGDYAVADNFFSVAGSPDLWTRVECHDVIACLQWLFPKFPPGARIFHGLVASDRDVTPYDGESLEHLRSLRGDFIVLAGPASAAVIVAVILVVAAIAAAFLLKPSVPSPATRQNSRSTSPNNELSSRTNEARPNGRIPDIYGTLRATPDLITPPFLQYINNQEVEDVVLCLGRGSYTIHDARDGETPMEEIDGATIQIYRPNTDINAGSPYFSIGTAFTERAVNVMRSNSVNGQEMKPVNKKTYTGSRDIVFRYPNLILTGSSLVGVFSAGDQISISNAVEYDQQQYTVSIRPYSVSSFVMPYVDDAQVSLYGAAHFIEFVNARFPVTYTDSGDYSTTVYANLSGIYTVTGARKITVQTGYFPVRYEEYCEVLLSSPVQVNSQWYDVSAGTAGAVNATHILYGDIISDFNGDYTVVGVSSSQVSLSDPSSVSESWQQLADRPNQRSTAMSPTLTSLGVNWIGPFFLPQKATKYIYANFVALNSLYMDNGQKQYAVSVTIALEVTPANDKGQATGSAVVHSITLTGSKVGKEAVCSTLKAALSVAGPCLVRARRTTPTNTSFEGSVVDEVKWKDLYAVADLVPADFGDVTMIRLRTYATAGALALKERKLNLLVTRELPMRIGIKSFSAELYPTNSGADIFSAIALDPKIGARSVDEVDFDNVYSTIDDIISYFGTVKAAEFAYTFDSDNLTFEESAQMVAAAVFCKAYRRGSIVRLLFEKKTDRASLLFNHRNKLPGTETRTVTFGYENDHDGVEFEYVSPDDDAVITYRVPEDGSARKPQKIESAGVRSTTQAHFHTWRSYNKLLNQHTEAEFTATQEANLLVSGDRVLSADNTVPGTQDGEITGQDGLIVFTSQRVSLEAGRDYSLFLQLPDGSVDSIPVTAGPDQKSLVLARAPRLALVTEDGMYANTTYMLSGEQDADVGAFLLANTDPQDNFTVAVSVVNYSDAYYANDGDYINGLIAEG